ncbi:hypothetical protein SETIT_2G145800v2 [Setaria italica]|uniref:CYP99A17 n=1 Tax=Setaria italica TaxID=4555 RepID=K3ZSK7_SETIT|nr:cytochrome P450 99A2 [Setaria italica]QJA42334.1 CYP99A17 [Setaria italica]RCV10906.1 hypothetical protein SETIT_2G145800v2 [Setaria italica]
MELSAATLIFLSLLSLPILVTLLSRKRTPSSKKRRPPGPWNVPLIGSLHHFLKSLPQVALRDLAKKYGPVMFLRMGQIDTVVISSPAAAQEVLREKDIIFASRPSIVASEIFCYGNLDIGFSPYGAYWRTLRKLCTVELLSAKMVRQLAPVRDNETLSLIRSIQAAGQGGKPVNLGSLLLSCSNMMTAKAAFGHVCSSELREQFLSGLDVGMQFSGGFTIGDLFPSLRFIDVISGRRRRMWRAHRQLDAVFDKIITQCEALRGDSLVSVLLRIRDEEELEFPMGTTNIKAIIMDMFTGGTETTSSAAEWVMSELMRNPEVMIKAQAEVRQVFDNKNPQDHEGMMDELHYTRMVIKESMRLNPVLPLMIPHLCRETCDIGGFEVKEGTRVMVNTWAMARNPEYWHDAEKFKPERFEDGTIDYKGSRIEYLPFGMGRRRCPGDTFGLVSLELIIARLLYYVDWSLPSGMHEIDMDMLVGATARRKNQLHLVASPYKVVPVQT